MMNKRKQSRINRKHKKAEKKRLVKLHSEHMLAILCRLELIPQNTLQYRGYTLQDAYDNGV